MFSIKVNSPVRDDQFIIQDFSPTHKAAHKPCKKNKIMENQTNGNAELAKVIQTESRRWLKFITIALVLYLVISEYDSIKHGFMQGWHSSDRNNTPTMQMAK